MDDELEKTNDTEMNPDALEDALGDYVEIDEEEEEIIITDLDEDHDLDIAFYDDDPRDHY